MIPAVHDASTYTNHRCRCEDCRAAHNRSVARRRRERRAWLSPGPDGRLVSTADISHGVASSYQNWGCRCVRCTRAEAASKRHWRVERS